MPATSDGELLNLECEIQAPTEQRCTHLNFFGLQFDEVDKLFALFAHAVPAIKFKRGGVNTTASEGARTCSARRP